MCVLDFGSPLDTTFVSKRLLLRPYSDPYFGPYDCPGGGGGGRVLTSEVPLRTQGYLAHMQALLPRTLQYLQGGTSRIRNGGSENGPWYELNITGIPRSYETDAPPPRTAVGT